MTFDGYHWDVCSFADESVSHARRVLADGRYGPEATSAFAVLLEDGHPAAIGLAMDHYHHSDASQRHGAAHPFRTFYARVLDRAREVMDEAPLAAGAFCALVDGANHASALLAVMNLATEDDADRIARILREESYDDVVSAALMTAGNVLGQAVPHNSGLVRTLVAMVEAPALSTSSRRRAVRALGSRVEEVDVLALLVSLLRLGSDVRLQVDAAFILAEHDIEQHRSLLETTVASWPSDAPFPAAEVRYLVDS